MTIKTKGSPSYIDKRVGEQLRMRRMICGISQEKIAGALGITFQQIQKYEKGTNRISAGNLYRISEFLNVPMSYFYEGLVAQDEPLTEKPAKLSHTQAQIMRLLPNIPDKTQRAVMNMLREIAA